MFALAFRFPAGRYHATPWGRHVNEGQIAWPPEPYRILRALIATWHRKGDYDRFDESALRRLIDALADELPLFRLPDAVHAHTRHYMPQGKLANYREETKLVFDAFLRLAPEDDLVALWPLASPSEECFALAEHLAERMNYFGRAESLVSVRAVCGAEWRDSINAQPEASTEPRAVAVEVLTPLSPQAYAADRPGLLALNADRPRSKSRQSFEATLPPTLCEALAVETAALQAAGWSQPPAGRFVVYHRPEIGPRPPAHRFHRVSTPKPSTVARLVLAGRPLPRIEDTVRIGEVFRLALMSQIDRSSHEIPASLSGRAPDGASLRDPQHAHAFFLPEDHNSDGFIDHLVLYIASGLPSSVAEALDRLRRLWIANRRPPALDDDTDMGREEWRVALEGFGNPADFADCALLAASDRWISATPYLRPWHAKRSPPETETKKMAEEECRRRNLPIVSAEFDDNPGEAGFGRSVRVAGSRRNVLHFHRFRSRRGLVQPDRSGAALRLTFTEPVHGPVALGFGCHFGLGLFRAE